jgi:hypothetical protein
MSFIGYPSCCKMLVSMDSCVRGNDNEAKDELLSEESLHSSVLMGYGTVRNECP